MNTDIREIVQKRKKRKTKGEIFKRRALLVLFVLVAVYLAFEFGHQGYIYYYDLEHQLTAARMEQKKLEAHKKELTALSKQYNTIEGKKELGREAGLVGGNEVRIIVLPAEKEQNPKKTTEK